MIRIHISGENVIAIYIAIIMQNKSTLHQLFFLNKNALIYS